MTIPGDGTPSRTWRVALYSHDTMGLGHLRRNLLIARTLADSPWPMSILMIAGAREASAFALPPGVDGSDPTALRANRMRRAPNS